jgi:hypothetical protein
VRRPQRAVSALLQPDVFVFLTVVIKTCARTTTPIERKIIPLNIFAISKHPALLTPELP